MTGRDRSAQEHAVCGLSTKRVRVTITLPDGRKLSDWIEMGSGRASNTLLRLPAEEYFEELDRLMREVPAGVKA